MSEDVFTIVEYKAICDLARAGASSAANSKSMALIATIMAKCEDAVRRISQQEAMKAVVEKIATGKAAEEPAVEA